MDIDFKTHGPFVSATLCGSVITCSWAARNGHRERLELAARTGTNSSPDYYVVAFDQFENVSVIISMIISSL
jgi:hypothetical protein